MTGLERLLSDIEVWRRDAALAAASASAAKDLERSAYQLGAFHAYRVCLLAVRTLVVVGGVGRGE